jgi:hypothetical protein
MFESSQQNVRRTVLLLVTTALALIAAGGIALAATFTCTTNPCNGTTQADEITGTVSAETINAKAGNDQISARDANDVVNGQGGDDTMNAELGNDKLSGGPNNDTMDGGDGNDSYRFADSFGADRIEADSSGVDSVDFSRIRTPLNTDQYSNGITIDLVGPDPLCDTTLTYCLSLGGEFIENIMGTPFGDYLTGNSLKNNIRGGDGWDYLNGQAGNDRLLGGGNDDPYDNSNPSAFYSSFDFYTLTPNWGKDTITDSGGEADRVMPVDNAAAEAMEELTVTVNLVSGPGPEYTDGNGNTVNWDSNSVIEGAATGAGDDVISQSPAGNDMYGGEGSDTYTGYVPDVPPYDPSRDNSDTILDREATPEVPDSDVLDLSSYNLADTGIGAPRTGFGTIHYLTIRLQSPTDFSSVPTIWVYNYFDDKSTDRCASKQGTGLIETIKFADDDNVDFAQVRRLLGCT